MLSFLLFILLFQSVIASDQAQDHNSQNDIFVEEEDAKSPMLEAVEMENPQSPATANLSMFEKPKFKKFIHLETQMCSPTPVANYEDYSDVDEIVRLLTELSKKDIKEATAIATKLLTDEKRDQESDVKAFVENGFLSIYLENLKSENSELHMLGGYALANIAGSTHTKTLVDTGILEPLMKVFGNTPDEPTQDALLQTIANILGDEATCKSAFKQIPTIPQYLMGNIEARLESNNTHDKNVVENSAWALYNLAQNCHIIGEVITRIIMTCNKMMKTSNDTEVLSYAAWTLEELLSETVNRATLPPGPQIKAWTEENLEILLTLLRRQEPQLALPILTSIKHLFTWNLDDCRDVIPKLVTSKDLSYVRGLYDITPTNDKFIISINSFFELMAVADPHTVLGLDIFPIVAGYLEHNDSSVRITAYNILFYLTSHYEMKRLNYQPLIETPGLLDKYATSTFWDDDNVVPTAMAIMNLWTHAGEGKDKVLEILRQNHQFFALAKTNGITAYYSIAKSKFHSSKDLQQFDKRWNVFKDHLLKM